MHRLPVPLPAPCNPLCDASPPPPPPPATASQFLGEMGVEVRAASADTLGTLPEALHSARGREERLK